MLKIDWDDEIVKEGPHKRFIYKGKLYLYYQRFYGDNSFDIEVYKHGAMGDDVDGEIFAYAEKLFEKRNKNK